MKKCYICKNSFINLIIFFTMKKNILFAASAALIMLLSGSALAQPPQGPPQGFQGGRPQGAPQGAPQQQGVRTPPNRVGGTQLPDGQQAPRMTAEMTEFYDPVPPTVTPGKFDAKNQNWGAPSDAIILFDGTNLDEWESVRGGEAQWTVADGKLTVNKRAGDIITKREFGDFQIHLEWCMPVGIQGSGQSRGNSGLKIGGSTGYEIQILDGVDNPTYVNGMVGSVYKQTIPLANPSRPNGEWQYYDLIFTAPTFNKLGQYRTKPRVTLIYNGVVVLNDVEIIGTTSYIGIPPVNQNTTYKLLLQAHGDPSEPISFRNIWIREL